MNKFIVAGTVERIFRSGNCTRIQLSTGHTLTNSRGGNGYSYRDGKHHAHWRTPYNHRHEVTVGKFYVFSCRQDTKQGADYTEGVDLVPQEAITVNHSDSEELIQAMKNLRASTKKVTTTLGALTANERQIYLGGISTTLSGGFCVLSGIQATTQAINWATGGPFNPVTFAISSGVTVLTGAATALQLENLQANIKAYQQLQATLKRDLDVYMRCFRKFIPQSGLNGIPLNAVQRGLIADLKRFFKVDPLEHPGAWYTADLSPIAQYA